MLTEDSDSGSAPGPPGWGSSSWPGPRGLLMMQFACRHHRPSLIDSLPTGLLILEHLKLSGFGRAREVSTGSANCQCAAAAGVRAALNQDVVTRMLGD